MFGFHSIHRTFLSTRHENTLWWKKLNFTARNFEKLTIWRWNAEIPTPFLEPLIHFSLDLHEYQESPKWWQKSWNQLKSWKFSCLNSTTHTSYSIARSFPHIHIVGTFLKMDLNKLGPFLHLLLLILIYHLECDYDVCFTTSKPHSGHHQSHYQNKWRVYTYIINGIPWENKRGKNR